MNIEGYKLLEVKFNNHKVPQFKVVKEQSYVQFGDVYPYRNRYPDYLLNLFDRANKHSAFLRAKMFYIFGNGLTIDKVGKTVGDSSKLLSLLHEVNEYGETITEITNKVVFDYEIFNGAYLEINWSRSGKNFDVTHMPFEKLRASVDKKGYYYSNDWSKPKDQQTKELTGYEFIPNFDAEKRTGKQIYCLKDYTAGSEYYPKPNYLGLIPMAETEYEIANYHLNSIKSGFHLGTIISFVGKPTTEEQEGIEKQLKEKFEGTDRAGSLLLQFSRDKDSAPVITRISPDELAEKFVTLTKHIEQELTAGHHMNPILAGIKTEGQLGGRSEIDVAHELFKKTYVKKRQQRLEKWLNKLFSYVGFNDSIVINEVSPISPFDYKDILNYMTKNEVRQLAGLPELKEEKKAVFSSQSKEDEVLNEFESVGEESENFDVLESYDVTPEVLQTFARNLNEFEKSILALLSKDSLLTDDAIAEALKVSKKKVSNTIAILEEDGYLTSKEVNQEGIEVRKVKISPDGKAEAKDSNKWGTEVRYTYEWRSEIPEGQRDSSDHPSRKFCKKMLQLSKTKMFTRAEIDQISTRVGINVWEFRGGWWNDDGVNSPSCRHIWKSHIVKRKSNG